jgi:purine-binding chemotaxis protein CheW
VTTKDAKPKRTRKKVAQAVPKVSLEGAPEQAPDPSPAGSDPEPGSPPWDGLAPGETMRIVVFELDAMRYALPIEVVQEIQQIVAVSELPDETGAVIGVINLRGTVVPAIDLRRLVGLSAREYDLQTPMVFVRTTHGVVALVVDEVDDVIEVSAASVQAPSSLYALADRLLCVCRLEGGLVFVFDIDRLVGADVVAAGRR